MIRRILAIFRQIDFYLAHHRVWQVLGACGTVVLAAIFIQRPSFPSPDKLLVFLTFFFMIFGQARAMLKRFLPFVLLLLVYESFRGLAAQLNTHVNYLWMPAADRWLFGGELPTITLQHWLWHNQVQWYDFFMYIFYMLHFVFPLGLAILIWKTREKYYWQYMCTYVVLSFAGFLTYLLFPAAPPWMAAEKGLIPPITRISSEVWAALGIHDFPTLYHKIAPNPVAAVPSLHAAYATLFTIFVTKLFGKKWGVVSLVYPFAIYIGTVYQGEHYAIDAILGIVYAIAAFLLTSLLFKRYLPRLKKWPPYRRILKRTGRIVKA